VGFNFDPLLNSPNDSRKCFAIFSENEIVLHKPFHEAIKQTLHPMVDKCIFYDNCSDKLLKDDTKSLQSGLLHTTFCQVVTFDKMDMLGNSSIMLEKYMSRIDEIANLVSKLPTYAIEFDTIAPASPGIVLVSIKILLMLFIVI
jgi:hypothetical protein